MITIVVDPVHDFVHEEGTLARAFGLEETKPFRDLQPVLADIVSTFGHQIILVTSDYSKAQFSTEGLCTTEQGRAFMVNHEKQLRAITKRDQSILACSNDDKKWLLSKIAHRTIFICGVTSTESIQATVLVLRDCCKRIIIARDSIADRVSLANQETILLDSWMNEASDDLVVYDSWQQIDRSEITRKLYYKNESITSMRVLMALYATQIDFTPEQISKSSQSLELLQMNPRGKTPVLVEPEFEVEARESLALLTYIQYHRDAKTSLLPADNPRSFTHVLALVQESELVRQYVKDLKIGFQSKKQAKSHPFIERVIETMAQLITELQTWDTYAKNGDFIAGTDSLSLADCAFFPVLMWLVHNGYPLMKTPHLKAYFEHMIPIIHVKRSIPTFWKKTGHTQGANLWKIVSAHAHQLPSDHHSATIVRQFHESVSSPEPKDSHTVIPQSLELSPEAVANIRKQVFFIAEKTAIACAQCGIEFPSKTKLHQHILQVGAHGSNATPLRKSMPAFDLEFYKKGGFGPSRPLCSLGSGDSMLMFDILPPELADFEKLKEEIKWNVMVHRGGPVPRLVAFQCDVTDHSAPLYRHPTESHPDPCIWTPTVAAIRRVVEERLQQRFNHALIQLYRDGVDFISEHADKTLDIVRNTVIVNVSLGASRVMVIRPKRDCADRITTKQRITLPHNSMFCLGWETNLTMTHEIHRDKRLEKLKRPDEVAFGGQRISFTFRLIGTFLRNDGLVYGQGARCKTEVELANHTPVDDSRDMVLAFSNENNSSNFNWDEHYGGGFDAIDIST